MSRTIANTLTTGITLSSSDNPVTITSTGRISDSAYDAIRGYSTGLIPWTVTNAGVIIETNGSGNAVQLKTTNYGINNTFINQSGGLVTSTHNGVVLNGAGVVINQANATITSTDTNLASAVYIAGHGTVVNAGLIKAANTAIYVKLGGSVTNAATGTIMGAGGVYLGGPYSVGSSGPSTVTNAGTIIGTNPSYGAVNFYSTSGSSRLIVDPGAVFSGKIISRIGSTNVIELASGSSAGTLAGFDGNSITNFATLQFDAGAAWTVKGNSGATGLGSIAITGFTIGDTIDLTDFVAVSETFANNALVLTNASNAHTTLHIQGSFSSSDFAVASDGTGGTDLVMPAAPLAYGQTIDKTGIVAASETVAAGTMTLFNAGGTAVGAITVGTSLSTGDFILKSDGAGGTDVIVKTVFGTYASGVTLLTNPTTIGSVAKVSNGATGGSAVSGPTGTNWTLVNNGLVSETGSNGVGISLAQAGTITNAAGATITASAASGTGVSLAGGGVVTNQAAGTISAAHGIRISGTSGTVQNLGLINSDNNGGAGGDGVYLAAGGKVINGASGGTVSAANIHAYSVGVHFGATGTDTLVNYGTVYGQGAPGAVLNTGTVINGANGATGAQIKASGDTALRIATSGTVFNYGTINDANPPQSGSVVDGVAVGRTRYYGVLLNGGGIINNIGTASLINGYVGVYGRGGVTVTNAGTIASYNNGVGNAYFPSPLALQFGAGANRLIVDPGAVFIGTVDGSGTTSGTGTLELASGASAGVLSGLGSKFIHFAQTTIDAGATWTLAGPNTIAAGTMLTNAGTLTNTGSLTLMDATLSSTGAFINNGGIVIDPSTMTVADLSGTGSITIAAGATLEVTGSIASTETILLDGTAAYLHLDNPAAVAGRITDLSIGETIDLKGIDPASVHESAGTLTIDGVGGFALTLSAGDKLAASASADGTALTAVIACFAEGTAIATPSGPVPVEFLRAGDLVQTAAGTVRPVRWIGYRTIDLTRHPAPERAQPIRIAAGAFADGVPSRDLRLSPDHAVLLDGLLIPVKLLRNDASIIRETGCRRVTYYHVELDTHDVLLAEGLAAESYIDTGNRATFENADLPLDLHPRFEDAQAQREAASCVPFVTDPVRVEPVWRALADRAAALGFAGQDDGAAQQDGLGLCLVTTAGRIRPLSQSATCLAFLLPAGTEQVRLVSFVASQPWIDDPRRRGVAVTRVTLRTGSVVETLALDHPSLCSGWWDTERDGGRMWRWTDGDATLALATDGPAILEVQVADTGATRLAA